MKKKDIFTKLNFIYAFVLILGILLFVIAQSGLYDFEPYSSENLLEYSQGWYGKNGKIEDLSAYRTDSTDSYTVTNTLPVTIYNGSSLNFRSKNINFAVEVDGEIRYEFSPVTDNASGVSYGSCIHSVELYESDAGKEVSFILYPDYNDSSCFINMIMIGDSGSYINEFLRSHLPSFLTCAAIIFTGISILLIFFSTKKRRYYTADLISLGIFAIIIGTWSAFETLVPQLLLGKTVLFHSLNYLFLIMMPYPAIKYANSILIHGNHKYEKITLVSCLSILCICACLNFFQVYDFHQMLWLVHLNLAFTALIIIVMFVKDYYVSKQEKIDHYPRAAIIAFGCCVVLCIVDLCIYAFSNKGSSDAGYFMRIGLLIFFAITAVDAYRKLLDKSYKASQVEFMEHLAHTDPLTSMYNRTAFMEDEEFLQTKIDSKERKEVLIVQMDINQLKMINDSQGHLKGDEQIQNAAIMILRAFEDYGDCYRTGGDEFTVFMNTDANEDTFHSCYQTLRSIEDEYNQELEDPINTIRIACGYAIASKEIKISLAEQTADQRMYADKKKIKEDAIKQPVQ